MASMGGWDKRVGSHLCSEDLPCVPIVERKVQGRWPPNRQESHGPAASQHDDVDREGDDHRQAHDGNTE